MTPLGAPSGAGEALQRIYDKCQRALISASHDSAYDLALAVGQMAGAALDAARALPSEPGLTAEQRAFYEAALHASEQKHLMRVSFTNERRMPPDGVMDEAARREDALDRAYDAMLAAEAAPTREGGA